MEEHTRAYTWSEPTAASALGGTGLELLRGMIGGALPRPPMATHARLHPGGVPAAFHYNPLGMVHGGLAMTVLDSAMGCAVHSTLAAGDSYTTLETKVNMTRAITATTGRLVCEATTLHVGRRIATAEGRVTDATGRLHAHGSTTCLVELAQI